MYRRYEVQIDQIEFVLQVGFTGELTTDTNTRVDGDRIHWSASRLNLVIERLNTIIGSESNGEIGLLASFDSQFFPKYLNKASALFATNPRCIMRELSNFNVALVATDGFKEP
ncbi:hypothetical protein [Nostoc sp.]|uniref:hypothetical protein n=1 Tax=Nostoc sp. TaxID=1180 RepID=UPI002FFA5E29